MDVNLIGEETMIILYVFAVTTVAVVKKISNAVFDGSREDCML